MKDDEAWAVVIGHVLDLTREHRQAVLDLIVKTEASQKAAADPFSDEAFQNYVRQRPRIMELKSRLICRLFRDVVNTTARRTQPASCSWITTARLPVLDGSRTTSTPCRT